jgi:hypothetical protein
MSPSVIVNLVYGNIPQGHIKDEHRFRLIFEPGLEGKDLKISPEFEKTDTLWANVAGIGAVLVHADFR